MLDEEVFLLVYYMVVLREEMDSLSAEKMDSQMETQREIEMEQKMVALMDAKLVVLKVTYSVVLKEIQRDEHLAEQLVAKMDGKDDSLEQKQVVQKDGQKEFEKVEVTDETAVEGMECRLEISLVDSQVGWLENKLVEYQERRSVVVKVSQKEKEQVVLTDSERDLSQADQMGKRPVDELVEKKGI